MVRVGVGLSASPYCQSTWVAEFQSAALGQNRHGFGVNPGHVGRSLHREGTHLCRVKLVQGRGGDVARHSDVGPAEGAIDERPNTSVQCQRGKQTCVYQL